MIVELVDLTYNTCMTDHVAINVKIPMIGKGCSCDKELIELRRMNPFMVLYLDRYHVAYKPITLPCISFMFIEMKFIHSHSYVIFTMKSMSICND